MLNLTALFNQTVVAQQRSATCVDYWLENSTTFNIKHDPMHKPTKASFYKGSGN